ncbi:MAG TPA: T9SS type A sorting domain-containing protein [Bacteroidales bacterium]|nr:T9SS type A sorting domain-containing protein [Bacteroidales bacterium]
MVLEGLLPVYCQNDAPSTLTGIPEGGFFTGGSLTNNVFDPSAVLEGNHTIYYQLTTADGCVGIDSASALVIAFDKTIDLGEDKSICPHETLLLDAGEGFDAYYWSTGQSSRQLEIQGTMFLPGTLRTISVAGVLNGCVAADAIQLSIRSDCYIGQEEVNERQPFTVYPNPAKGNIGLLAEEELTALKLSLLELSGREVWQSGQAVSVAAGVHITFDVKDVKPGVYVLRLDSSSRQFQLKIVLQ